jgi:hypothetical protein
MAFTIHNDTEEVLKGAFRGIGRVWTGEILLQQVLPNEM